MKTTTRKPLHKDAYCRIFEDAQGQMHVKHLSDGRIFTPHPIEYADFSSRDFADLYAELVDSGIPEGVAGRWVNQAQGFQV